VGRGQDAESRGGWQLKGYARPQVLGLNQSVSKRDCLAFGYKMYSCCAQREGPLALGSGGAIHPRSALSPLGSWQDSWHLLAGGGGALEAGQPRGWWLVTGRYWTLAQAQAQLPASYHLYQLLRAAIGSTLHAPRSTSYVILSHVRLDMGRWDPDPVPGRHGFTNGPGGGMGEPEVRSQLPQVSVQIGLAQKAKGKLNKRIIYCTILTNWAVANVPLGYCISAISNSPVLYSLTFSA
jgi:hypothetical protein